MGIYKKKDFKKKRKKTHFLPIKNARLKIKKERNTIKTKKKKEKKRNQDLDHAINQEKKQSLTFFFEKFQPQYATIFLLQS